MGQQVRSNAEVRFDEKMFQAVQEAYKGEGELPVREGTFVDVFPTGDIYMAHKDGGRYVIDRGEVDHYMGTKVSASQFDETKLDQVAEKLAKHRARQCKETVGEKIADGFATVGIVVYGGFFMLGMSMGQ